MPTLKLVNGGGELQVSDAAFGQQFNESLVHQVVTAYRNAGRSGTKAQKTRAEVRGGGRKPWSQKGTGQARAGSGPRPVLGGGRPAARAAVRSGWVVAARSPRSPAASSRRSTARCTAVPFARCSPSWRAPIVCWLRTESSSR